MVKLLVCVCLLANLLAIHAHLNPCYGNDGCSGCYQPAAVLYPGFTNYALQNSHLLGQSRGYKVTRYNPCCVPCNPCCDPYCATPQIASDQAIVASELEINSSCGFYNGGGYHTHSLGATTAVSSDFNILNNYNPCCKSVLLKPCTQLPCCPPLSCSQSSPPCCTPCFSPLCCSPTPRCCPAPCCRPSPCFHPVQQCCQPVECGGFNNHIASTSCKSSCIQSPLFAKLIPQSSIQGLTVNAINSGSHESAVLTGHNVIPIQATVAAGNYHQQQLIRAPTQNLELPQHINTFLQGTAHYPAKQVVNLHQNLHYIQPQEIQTVAQAAPGHLHHYAVNEHSIDNTNLQQSLGGISVHNSYGATSHSSSGKSTSTFINKSSYQPVQVQGLNLESAHVQEHDGHKSTFINDKYHVIRPDGSVYKHHPSYKFEYSVNDHKSGDIHQQKEEREGDVVKGEYSLVEPDGNVRTVKYTADWKTGFHAEIINSKTKS